MGNSAGGQQNQVPNPWKKNNLGDWLDNALANATVSANPAKLGVVDVRHTTIPALMSLGLDRDTAARVRDAGMNRSGADKSAAWLATENVVPFEIFQQMEPYITVRTSVFHVDAVGYMQGTRQTVRMEAIIDVTDGTPKVVWMRDLPAGGLNGQLLNPE
jgi:hypothetical protein